MVDITPLLPKRLKRVMGDNYEPLVELATKSHRAREKIISSVSQYPDDRVLKEYLVSYLRGHFQGTMKGIVEDGAVALLCYESNQGTRIDVITIGLTKNTNFELRVTGDDAEILRELVGYLLPECRRLKDVSSMVTALKEMDENLGVFTLHTHPIRDGLIDHLDVIQKIAEPNPDHWLLHITLPTA